MENIVILILFNSDNVLYCFSATSQTKLFSVPACINLDQTKLLRVPACISLDQTKLLSVPACINLDQTKLLKSTGMHKS